MAWIWNGSTKLAASIAPRFRAGIISGNGIATNSTFVGSPPSSAMLAAAATCTIDVSALTATVRPSRSLGRKIPLFAALRSEEHTSELQSRFDLVCRLLLEKKNTDPQTVSRVQRTIVRREITN